MKRINFILTLCLFFLLIIKVSNTSDGFCVNCPLTEPPPNECKIDCNTTQNRFIDISQIREYLTFYLPGRMDVYIRLNMSTLEDYDQFINYTPTVCPSETNYDCKRTLGFGTPYICSRGNIYSGRYYIMVNHSGTIGAGTGNYTVNLTCGHWCGNGVKEDKWEEDCDYNASYVESDGLCRPYEYCSYYCDCHNFTSEMRGCNYYDFCDLGLDPDTGNSCCMNSTGQSVECCIDNVTHNPIPNCNTTQYPNAVRNPDAIAKRENCWAEGYDITDICIDTDYRGHRAQTCSVPVCGDGVCQENESPENCPEDCA